MALISQDVNRTKIENKKKVTENGHFPFKGERRNKKKAHQECCRLIIHTNIKFQFIMKQVEGN